MRAAPPDKRLRFIQEEEEETSGGNVEVQVHHIDAKEHHGTNKNGRDGDPERKEEESEKLLPSASALSPKRPPRPRPLQMPKEDIDFVLAWNGRSEREASEVEAKNKPVPHSIITFLEKYLKTGFPPPPFRLRAGPEEGGPGSALPPRGKGRREQGQLCQDPPPGSSGKEVRRRLETEGAAQGS